MKKTRLYDFSASTAVTVSLAYVFLLLILGAAWLDGHSTLIGVLFVLLLLSYLTVVVYFVLLAPKMESKQLSHGDKKILKKNLQYKAAYDPRFKEKALLFWDKKTDLPHLSPKEYKRKTIRVQATPSNVRKIEEWLGVTVVVPEKPKRQKLFKRR